MLCPLEIGSCALARGRDRGFGAGPGQVAIDTILGVAASLDCFLYATHDVLGDSRAEMTGVPIIVGISRPCRSDVEVDCIPAPGRGESRDALLAAPLGRGNFLLEIEVGALGGGVGLCRDVRRHHHDNELGSIWKCSIRSFEQLAVDLKLEAPAS
jgi:hypothetical protein